MKKIEEPKNIKFEEAVKRHNGTDEDLHLLAQSEGDSFIDKTAKKLVAFGAMQRNAFPVLVNYDLPHNLQIEEVGFDWITDYDGNLILKNPTEHLYPLPVGRKKQRITLVPIDCPAKKEAVLARMEELNVRPTLSPEFLALTRAFPDLQRQFPLIGLGSVWAGSGGNRLVLYACESSGERDLRLRWDDREWDVDFRFPAVCL